MKFIFSFVLIWFPSLSLACADFSGLYTVEYGYTMRITQHGCASSTEQMYDYSGNALPKVHVYYYDGIEREKGLFRYKYYWVGEKQIGEVFDKGHFSLREKQIHELLTNGDLKQTRIFYNNPTPYRVRIWPRIEP